ncbi:MAG: hypothetical protein AB3N14_11805, partial [Flavobacteriaceae bacterium]
MLELNEIFQKIVQMSYGFFANTTCTPGALNEFLDMVEQTLLKAGVSRSQAYDQLERKHKIEVLDSSAMLQDHSDHIEWFNPDTNTAISRPLNWHFWAHYRGWLSAKKNWSKGIVDNIDQEASKVLAELEDPHRPGIWDCRGMVVGSVQSGKTANYTGVI